MFKSLLFFIPVSGFLNLNAQAPPSYEIYALKYFGIHSTPVSEMALGAPAKDTINTVFMYWLIRGNNRIILVDAGFLKDLDIYRELKTSFYIRPDSVLLELNIKADEITDIILTHPHWDHVDGVRSMQRMKTQASDIKFIIPGHDPAVFSRFPMIKPDIVKIK